MASARMPSHLSYLTILLLLAFLAPPCTPTTTDTDNNGGNITDADAGRRARAAATVADLLSAHNAARRAVGVEPLKWSPEIAGYAKVFARSRRADCEPRRSSLFYFGENLVAAKGRQWSAAALVSKWVAEGRWYDYGSNSCAAPAPDGAAGCARYTQVVWRNTTQLGCAKIVCASGDTLLCCEYFPPGNFGTGRPY